MDIEIKEVYLAGGCLWGVQEFLRYLPGIISTEAGRANGKTSTLDGEYDGYVECVKTIFNNNIITIEQLMSYLFEIIDPYSLNKQGEDVGEKYRTGVYSTDKDLLERARDFINNRKDAEDIAVEVFPLTMYVKSSDEHQDRLQHFPDDYCHIPKHLLYKYRD